MIIVLKTGATRAQAEEILKVIEGTGLKPLYLPGEERIVLGAIGDERVLAKLNLESLESVEQVVPILKPYKIAHQNFRSGPSEIEVCGVKIGGPSLAVIAGPCSVETREQIVSCARQVKNSGATLLRGGAFKPRTSPYAFQGLEREGLELLREAKAETGLPIVTEVLSEHDVALIGDYADMFQIGARNMQNFRLLKAVGNTSKPVLLKRGPAASPTEFLMAAEYILAEGNSNVVLCERGIKSFFSEMRNTLDLSVVPFLKRETHLPVIVDPSHGTGDRHLVAQMCLAGIAAGADGLIVEVHPDPDHAWSDGFQQLNFSEFHSMMQRVKRVAESVDRSLPLVAG